MERERIKKVETCRNIVSIYSLNMDVLSDTAGKTDAQSGFLYKHLLTFAIDMHSAFSSFFCLRKKQLNNPQLTYGVLLSYFSCEEAALEVLWSLVTQTKFTM